MLFYAGPDQIMPIASALSTIIGLALIFWGKLTQACRKVLALFSPKVDSPVEPRS
jgi:hypothetical protein